MGLYSIEMFAEQSAEPGPGLGMLVVFEEMFWGDAGIALSILGTGLAAAALAGGGTPEQLGEWLPQMFGTVDDPKVGSFCSSEPGAGSDVGAILTRARYDEATDEWVLNGTKTWATNGGIAEVHIVVASVYPELGSRGQVVGEDLGQARLDAVQGRVPRHRGIGLLVGGDDGGHVGVHVADVQRRDGDAAWRQLLADRVGQRPCRGLGRRVGAEARPGAARTARTAR